MEPSRGYGKQALKDRSDEELFREFSGTGNPEIIGELFRRYLHLVTGVCYTYLRDREAARDAVMQVFEQLLAKPAGKEIRSFKDWLFILTRNHCLMTLRHEKAGIRAHQEKFRELQAELMENSPLVHLMEEEEQERRFALLRAALARLPDEQRQCVELFYYEDRSYQEISDRTGYNLKKVKSCLQNGKRNLKIMLNHGRETSP